MERQRCQKMFENAKMPPTASKQAGNNLLMLYLDSTHDSLVIFCCNCRVTMCLLIVDIMEYFFATGHKCLKIYLTRLVCEIRVCKCVRSETANKCKQGLCHVHNTHDLYLGECGIKSLIMYLGIA